MLEAAIESFILGKAAGKDDIQVEVLKSLRLEDKEWLVHWYSDKLYGCVSRPWAWGWISLTKPLTKSKKTCFGP